MSHIVLQASPSTKQKMKAYYQKNLSAKAVPYTDFIAKKQDVTITAYTSGKVLFQGASAEKEAQIWQNDTVQSIKNSSLKSNPKLPENLRFLSVLGSDEVGNGSYFGPLCVCAAYVKKEQLALLQEMGVRDSKELTDPQILQLAKKLKQLIPYQLLVVSPKKYNAIQPTYNAVRMKVALHNQAIGLLLQKIAPEKPDTLLIDQFTPETNYQKYVKLEQNPVKEKIYFVTKGEKYHLAVAAASIISRASFLEELAAASTELGITLPSGAGSKSDQTAAEILKKGGLELLGEYAKLHFANTQKAQKLL